MTTALKDNLNLPAVNLLATQVAQEFPQFDAKRFAGQAAQSLADLSLTDRVRLLQSLLILELCPDLHRDASRLRQLAARWPADSYRGWECYAVWPLIEMIGECGRDDPSQALSLLADFTHLFTAEFAMRWYVRERLTEIHPIVMQWATSESPHIRRLASECLRPRLPWGGYIKSLQKEPAPILMVIEKLKDDPSRYVQKSVGNNLNDISKDRPELVLQTCERWLCDASPVRQQIVKRALRTLIKQGEPAVFPLLGYTEKPLLDTHFGIAPATIGLGDSVALTLTLESRATNSQQINIDYRLTMPGVGQQKRYKVFKWKTLILPAGERLVLDKTQPFSTLNTRRYYPGEYTIECLINGIPVAQASMQLVID